jgi:hypothetical protein
LARGRPHPKWAADIEVDDDKPSFDREPKTDGRPTVTEAELRAVVDRIVGWWKGEQRLAIEAVATFADLPVAIQKAARDQGGDGSDIRGVLHRARVLVVRANHTSAGEVEETVFHEVYGHYGYRLVAGPRLAHIPGRYMHG